MHGVKFFQVAAVLRIRTALVLSGLIVAVFAMLAHAMPAAASFVDAGF